MDTLKNVTPPPDPAPDAEAADRTIAALNAETQAIRDDVRARLASLSPKARKKLLKEAERRLIDANLRALTVTVEFEVELDDGSKSKSTLRETYDQEEVAALRKAFRPGAFADRESIVTFSGKRDLALIRALMTPPDDPEWKQPSDDYPHITDRYLTNFKISVGGEPGREGITPARVAELKPVFENIVDPKTVILYAACMDLWNRARQDGRNLTDLQAVRIHVDDLCELFGYKRHPNGSYQHVHKQEISRRLQDLRMLEGHGDYVDERGRQRRLRGAYAHITFDDYVPLLGKPEPYEFIVRPGDAVYKIIEDNPSLMRVYKSLAPLTIKEAHVKGSGLAAEYALKTGVYLCSIFRNRQATQSFSEPITIQTIIESSRIATDATKAVPANRYSDFRENIEAGFDLIVGRVIADWEYVAGDEEGLPDRGFFKPWLKNRVIFRPLVDALEAGKQRNAEQQRAITRRRRNRVRKGPSASVEMFRDGS